MPYAQQPHPVLLLAVHWQPTDAVATIIIVFLQETSDNKQCLQCIRFCDKAMPGAQPVQSVVFPLNSISNSFPGCGAPCSVCMCVHGGLRAAAGVRPLLTGAPVSVVQQPEQVRACVGVLSSSCLPRSLQFHFKQHTFPKGKDGRWHF